MATLRDIMTSMGLNTNDISDIEEHARRRQPGEEQLAEGLTSDSPVVTPTTSILGDREDRTTSPRPTSRAAMSARELREHERRRAREASQLRAASPTRQGLLGG